ncbi:MAG: multidrug efflux RND transporter permease subunit [Planctomycetota bacterium]|nr:MAG: multidrug efflux RND transporter permease subunit [Planctomycetota bacterium]
MVHFFIDRPIFAAVIALLIVLAGGICAFFLPIALYPDIVPPQVQVKTTYTGAGAEVVADTVTTPIEQKVNGVKGMIYMSSSSTDYGVSQINVSFDVGYSQDIAAVDVQNKVELAKPTLPAEVKQYGVEIKKTSTNMVCAVTLVAPEGDYDGTFLDNYAEINVVDVLRRIRGVSDVNLFGGKYAMRIWLDPDRMAEQGTTPGDVIEAIQNENVQAAAGKIGAAPVPEGQRFEYPVQAKGRLSSVAEFENIVVLGRPDGTVVRVADVARVELGTETYEMSSYLDGKPAATVGIYQLSDANSLDILAQVEGEMERLKQAFPEGIDYKIAYDTTAYVSENIAEVQSTLLEASGLAVLVVFVFLQGWRPTLIPLVTIPVSLIGTLAIMLAFGFSINTLTLFGLVLAIGTVVDDAIVVVENVQRQLAEGKGARQAVRDAMDEVAGPIVATSLVLAAVFVPVAFIPGLTGRLYNQFALAIVFAVLISTVNALTLSPALARILMAGHRESKFILFRWFNQGLSRAETGYQRFLGGSTRRWWITGLVAAALLVPLAYLFAARPKGFIPVEDQGYFFISLQAPDGTTREPTQAISRRISKMAEELPGVRNVLLIDGYNIVTAVNQPNVATLFVILDHWSERQAANLRAPALVNQMRMRLRKDIREATAVVAQPPSIPGLGTTGGFEFQLEDRQSKGVDTLAMVAQELFLPEARKRPELTGLFTSYSANVPHLFFDLDRTKARTLNVPVADVFNTLQTNLGGFYVNDFNLYGKVFKVMVQAEGDRRTKPQDILTLRVRSRDGNMVPLSALGEVSSIVAPSDVPHYNLYLSAKIVGEAAPGYSSGQAVQAMQEVAAQVLPEGFGYEWTGSTYQQLLTGNMVIYIFGLSILCVFLFLCAQYESWSLPLVILLAVPLAMLGAILALAISNKSLDVFGQIGLVMLVGLQAKSAILVVEFAKNLREQGRSAAEAAVEAARLRLRAILMTALTCVVGYIPLVTASGAGAASRQSLGTVVIGGMLLGTVLLLLIVPVFFVIADKLFNRQGAKPPEAAKAPVGP